MEFEGQRLTYAELNARANQLAHTLREKGVAGDTLVGVFMERSLEMVVALYGMCEGRRGVCADRSGISGGSGSVHVWRMRRWRWVLTREPLSEAIAAERKAGLVCIDTEWDAIGEKRAGRTWGRTISGTESGVHDLHVGIDGGPKGAQNGHRGIVNRLLWMQDRYGLRGGGRVLQKTRRGSTYRCGSFSGRCRWERGWWWRGGRAPGSGYLAG